MTSFCLLTMSGMVALSFVFGESLPSLVDYAVTDIPLVDCWSPQLIEALKILEWGWEGKMHPFLLWEWNLIFCALKRIYLKQL